MSILAEKRFSFSRVQDSQESEISSKELILHDLRWKLDEGKNSLEASNKRIHDKLAKAKAARSKMTRLTHEITMLRESKELLVRSTSKTKSSFDDYRAKYRKVSWRKAIGEKCDRLYLKTGRQYDRVIITHVTPFGLDISHLHGNARIDFRNLGSDYQNRFQWDEEECQKTVGRENMNHAPAALSRAKPKLKNYSVEVTNPETVDNRLTIIRFQNEVRISKIKAATLQSNYDNAISNSRYSSQRSVPGSLRTWTEQARILQTELARANFNHLHALERLRQVSPNDSLLLPENLQTPP
ncbi:MAG: hypothetical protein H7Y36_05870 [Armatimonadetes bacterium]|nr:hypothetical protein [Akkermansiaceae bacterium]